LFFLNRYVAGMFRPVANATAPARTSAMPRDTRSGYGRDLNSALTDELTEIAARYRGYKSCLRAYA
jgi:hypothetical protein